MQKTKVLSTLEEIKAFSDPYRLKIIEYMGNCGRAKTVKEIADALNETPAKVHYHMKKLEKSGIVEIEYTKEINGIIAKYYRLSANNYTIENSALKGPASGVIKGQTARLISLMYDSSKSVIINKINSDESINPNASQISSATVYLNKEEAAELKKYLSSFFEKHEKKDEGKSPHHLFISLMELDNEDNNI